MSLTLDECIKQNAEPSMVKYAISIKKMEGVILLDDEEGIYYILKKAYTLLVQHFLEKYVELLRIKRKSIENVRDKTGDATVADLRERRIDILYETDLSVSSFWKMLETAEQSTWNANRMTNPMKVGISPVSYVVPKLYAYYSFLVNDLANIYMLIEVPDSINAYAFCVNPSSEKVAYTEVLYESRIKHGKVSLIYLPQENIADIKRNQFGILHEFYHVLPIFARNREDRKDVMNSALLELFCEWLGKTETERKMIRRVLNHYIDIIITNNVDIREKANYGENTETYLIDIWKNVLRSASEDDDIDYRWTAIIAKHKHEIPKDEYEAYIDCVKSDGFKLLVERIIKEINEILSYGEVERNADLLMYLYRECFADLFSILTNGTSVWEYMEYLEYEIQEPLTASADDEYELKLRCLFVGETLRRFVTSDDETERDEGFVCNWRKGIECHFEIGKNSLYDACRKLIEEEGNINDPNKTKKMWQLLMISQDVSNNVIAYLLNCVNQWSRMQKENKDIFLNFTKVYWLRGSIRNPAGCQQLGNAEILHEISKRQYVRMG